MIHIHLICEIMFASLDVLKTNVIRAPINVMSFFHISSDGFVCKTLAKFPPIYNDFFSLQ